jgi:hypothetical protein
MSFPILSSLVVQFNQLSNNSTNVPITQYSSRFDVRSSFKNIGHREKNKLSTYLIMRIDLIYHK